MFTYHIMILSISKSGFYLIQMSLLKIILVSAKAKQISL